jgi:hypothetical protein
MTVDSIFKDKQTLKNDIKKECNDALQIEPIPLATSCLRLGLSLSKMVGMNSHC